MEFRILGPLEVVDGTTAIPLGGARQRALLTALLLHANETVSAERLLDELWSEHLPETGVKAVQVAVSQLRKTLDRGGGSNGPLVTRPQGYVLRVAPDQLDLDRFRSLVQDGRAALEAGDADRAASVLRDALALWRGPPLADVAFERFAQADIARLEEERLAAVEDLVDAELALGRHAKLVGELESLVARNPLRERLRGQLMVAFYGSGRQAEALESYAQFRRGVADTLGIEPGHALQRLQRQILVHDPELEPRVRRPGLAPRILPAGHPRRILLLVLAAGAVVTAGAAALILALGESDQRPPLTVPPNAVAVIDPSSNEVVAALPVGDSPGPVALEEDALWVINQNDSTLAKIDPAEKRVLSVFGGVLRFDRIGSRALLAAGEGLVLISEGETLLAFHPVSGSTLSTFDITPNVDDFWTGLAAGLGSVWLADGRPRLMEVEYPETRIVPLQAPTDAFFSSSSVAVGLGAVWVAFVAPGSPSAVFRYEPDVGAVTRVPLNGTPSAIAVGQGSVWVTDADGDSVFRIERRVAVAERIPVGDEPVAVAVGAGSVWTANAGDGTVTRIDPKRRAVVATIHLGNRPQGIAVAEGLVWVTVRSG